MQVLTVDNAGIQIALSILRQGGVVAHATETCYGFACDLRNPDAVKKLFDLKQRPGDQPVSALFSSVADAKQYVEWNDEAQRLAEKYLPGPLTLILKTRSDVPHPLHTTASYQLQATSSIGIRISSHPVAMSLVREFGSPLSTTSANLHGQPNPYSADEVAQQCPSIDLILDSGMLPKNPPSTVIDLTKNAQTLRQGNLQI